MSDPVADQREPRPFLISAIWSVCALLCFLSAVWLARFSLLFAVGAGILGMCVVIILIAFWRGQRAA